MPPLRAPSQFPPPGSSPSRRGPGVAFARRAPLVHTRGGQALSREAEEALFAHADLMSEGSPMVSPTGAPATRFFGTSMISVDLVATCAALRLPATPASFSAIAEAAEGSVRVRIRALRWARAEACRRVPESRLGSVSTEIRVHLRGSALHIDVDLEAPIELRGEAIETRHSEPS